MYKIIGLFLLTSAVLAQSSKPLNIRVSVQDEAGLPLAYANVFFKDGDFAGAVTNDSGMAVIPTGISGERMLVVSMIGYDPYEKKIKLPLAKALCVTLGEKSLELNAITIEASAYAGGEGKVALNKIDVYTTPGGAADIFQSIKVLPGVTQTDETAAIPVRGGSPSENLILFNGATLSHPYHSENTAGNGLFTVVETAVMRKLYFSSGGFSVKYGNALSGVLDIETENRIASDRIALDANLVSVGGGLQRTIVKDKLFVQVYGKHTSTNLLFKLNKPTFDVVEDPVSSNVTAIVNYHYSPTGQIQALALTSSDAQKFDLTLQSNNNRYDLRSANQIGSIQWSEVFYKQWFSKSSISYSSYQNRWTFGEWNRNNDEYNIKWRWDNNYDISSKTIVSFGSEIYADHYDLDFLLPRRRGEFYNGADSVRVSGNDLAAVIGSYAELQQKLARRWSASAGVRQDYHRLSRTNTFDLRSAVVYEAADNTFLRIAAGTFHQYPNIILYDHASGNRDLKPMEAKHLVTGFEKNTAAVQFKLEAYYKWYSKLPLEDPIRNYVSDGKGFARGVDVFLKGGIGRTSGWISYSYIQTRRREMDIVTERPSIYDITHNLKVITKNNLGHNFELASTLRLATGRPYTPIEGGVYHTEGAYWTPSYAAKNSGRFPTFKRLDARLSKMIFFGPQRWLVLYVEALNIFAMDNILDYSYSEDFSERDKIKSYFSNRTVVMGFSLNF